MSVYTNSISTPARRIACCFGLAIAFSFLFAYCDPPRHEIYPSEIVKITGIFNDVDGLLNLGDTLRFQIQVPDTLFASSGPVVVGSVQRAEFLMDICRLDTVAKRVVLLQPPLYWAGPGQVSASNTTTFLLRSATKPYQLDLHFTPDKKGLYFIGITGQMGQLRANNGFAARILVAFDLANRNTGWAEPFLGSSWANDVRFREAGGYVFRVI